MAEFRVVTVAELKPVLDVLNGLSWPMPFDEFPAIFESLGWEKNRRRGGLTSLPVSLKLVSVGQLGEEISSIEFRVSDTLPGTSPANKRQVKEAFPGAVDVVSECVGFGPTGTPWVDPGMVWDLADGRQIRLVSGDDTIELDYWSKRMADIERDQRRMGIDPANDMDESQYPA